MKALFIKGYYKITADMLIGAMIDMGVPSLYLKSELKDAGLSDYFIEMANPKAKIGAHYFFIPNTSGETDFTEESWTLKWAKICNKKYKERISCGINVIKTVTRAFDELNIKDKSLGMAGIDGSSHAKLYCILSALDYLGVENVLTCPFSVEDGKDEKGKITKSILKRAVTTTNLSLYAENITPFAAAILESISVDFLPMDGRFLVDNTAYGSDSVEKTDGENTLSIYLGYFHDRESSIFKSKLKVFGTKNIFS